MMLKSFNIQRGYIWLIILLACISQAFAPAHAFYVSITEIGWKANINHGQLILKIFTDDLEDALYYHYKRRTLLHQSLNEAETVQMLNKYLSSKIQIQCDGQAVNLTYQQGELLPDVVRIRFRIEQKKVPQHISIKHTLLLELFDTQANIVRLDIGGSKKVIKLDKSNQTGEFRF